MTNWDVTLTIPLRSDFSEKALKERNVISLRRLGIQKIFSRSYFHKVVGFTQAVLSEEQLVLKDCGHWDGSYLLISSNQPINML
jgi:hypothetical protein